MMRWKDWERTHQTQEWTAWDERDEWFLSVVQNGAVWTWYVAYAPGDGTPQIEHRAQASTREQAMEKSKAWAEQNHGDR